jgi:hypothetical protein
MDARTFQNQFLSFFSLSSWTVRFSALKENWNRQKQLDIRIINSFMFVFVFILAFYFVNNISRSFKKINNLEFRVVSGLIQTQGAKPSLRLKDISYYLEKIEKRDIFKMGPKKPVENVNEVISSKAAEATQNLKLVGISWSDNPDAIIEDTKEMRTFFLREGQMIGEIKVESISRDKVVLRYGEELIELR